MTKRELKQILKLCPDSMIESEVERVKKSLVWHKRCVMDDESVLGLLLAERIDRRKREGG